jgi:Flp pilus assembly protein TadG
LPLGTVASYEFAEEFAMRSTRMNRIPGLPAGRGRSESGQALVEFAVVIPVFVLILLAGADLLTAISAKHNIEYVAEETASCIANNGSNCVNSSGPQPQSYAQQVAASLGLTNTGALTATSSSCGSLCTAVTVTYPAAPLFAGFFPSVTLHSTAQHTIPGS